MKTIYVSTNKYSFVHRLLRLFGINFCIFIVLFGIVFFGSGEWDDNISLYTYVFLSALFLLNFFINISRSKNALIQCSSDKDNVEIVYESFYRKKTQRYKKDEITIEVQKAFTGASKQPIWYIIFYDGRARIRFYDETSPDFSFDTMKRIQDALQ